MLDNSTILRSLGSELRRAALKETWAAKIILKFYHHHHQTLDQTDFNLTEN